VVVVDPVEVGNVVDSVVVDSDVVDPDVVDPVVVEPVVVGVISVVLSDEIVFVVSVETMVGVVMAVEVRLEDVLSVKLLINVVVVSYLLAVW
jgi:hypothetical protein